MTNRLFTSFICSGALLLTACGGGSDSQTSFNGKEKLDYNKPETTETISEAVVNLSTESDNILFFIGMLTQGIYNSVNSADFSCETGTVKLNSNKSVTLDHCKNFKASSQGSQFPGTVSGTIQSTDNSTSSLQKNDLNLSEINIELAENSIVFNGKITHIATSPANNLISESYETDHSTLKFIEKYGDRNHYLYTLYNYQLLSNYYKSTGRIEDFAKGKMNGEFNGQVFSVNFASNFNFTSADDLYNFKPHSANVEITDLYNQKNTISIRQTTDAKALINTYADGKLVQTLVQEWDELL